MKKIVKYLLLISFFSNSYSQEGPEQHIYSKDSIIFTVNLGNYQDQIPDSVFRYLSKNFSDEWVWIFKNPSNNYRVEIGEFYSYGSAEPVLEKIIKAGHKSLSTYIQAHLCFGDISIEEAKKIKKQSLSKKELKKIKKTCASDSVYFSAMFFLFKDSISEGSFSKHSKFLNSGAFFDYIASNFKNEYLYMWGYPGKVYKVSLGKILCYERAVQIQEKLLQDGFKPFARPPHVFMTTFQCHTPERISLEGVKIRNAKRCQ